MVVVARCRAVAPEPAIWTDRFNLSKTLQSSRAGAALRAGLARLPPLALVLFCAALAAWRLECVSVGPDPDTDSYGHFGIARQLLETPLNFKVHWVWLPFYHYLLALGAYAGAGLDQVRSINAVLAAAAPLILCWVLRAGQPPDAAPLDRVVPYLAAFLSAAAPLAVQLGTSGQMEVFFSLLLLATASLARREHYASAALCLSVAALTRYEAWAVVAAAAAVFAGRRLALGVRVSHGALGLVLAPVSCVLAWVGLRWLGGEPWFWFIRANQVFAESVVEQRGENGFELAAVGRYVLGIPWRVLGLGALLAALGVRRALREEGIWWLAPPLAVLAFLTLSTLTQSQLGLDRHFFSVLPFVATWAAHGAVQVASWVGSAYAHFGRWLLQGRPGSCGRLRRGAQRASNASLGLLSMSLVYGGASRLDTSMQHWMEATRTALPEARAAGRFLRDTPPDALIACDDASVEVLSGLDADRFLRAPVGEDIVERLSTVSAERDVFVMSRASRIGGLRHRAAVVFEDAGGGPHAFIALHVPAGPRNASSGSVLPAAGR